VRQGPLAWPSLPPRRRERRWVERTRDAAGLATRELRWPSQQRCSHAALHWRPVASFASVCGARSVGPGCVAAQVDADTLEMLRTINAGSLPGVKEVAVRGAGAPGHAAGVG